MGSTPRGTCPGLWYTRDTPEVIAHLEADGLDSQEHEAFEQGLRQPCPGRFLAHDDWAQLAVVAHQHHLAVKGNQGDTTKAFVHSFCLAMPACYHPCLPLCLLDSCWQPMRERSRRSHWLLLLIGCTLLFLLSCLLDSCWEPMAPTAPLSHWLPATLCSLAAHWLRLH